MGVVRVAIVGVGNCASALIQGIEYYRHAPDDGFIPGPGGSDRPIPPNGRIKEVEPPVDLEELLSKYVFGKV